MQVDPIPKLTMSGQTVGGPVAEPAYCSAEMPDAVHARRLDGAWGHWRAMPHRGFESPPVRL